MPGRWSITPEKAKLFGDALRIGSYVRTALAYSGIKRSTWSEWMRLARAASEKQAAGKPLRGREREAVKIASSIQKRIAESEVMDLARIAASREWQASAWRLERRWPERWSRRPRVDPEEAPTGTEGGPVVEIGIDRGPVR